jgi:hypothetical protein
MVPTVPKLCPLFKGHPQGRPFRFVISPVGCLILSLIPHNFLRRKSSQQYPLFFADLQITLRQNQRCFLTADRHIYLLQKITMRFLSTMFALIASLQCAFAMDADTTKRYELTGMLSYSYDNQQEQNPDRYGIFPRNHRIHNVSIHPGFGYFLTPEIELASEIQYALAFTEYNHFNRNSSTSEVVEYLVRYWSHRVGGRVGANYHFIISPTAMVFIVT